VRSRWTLEEALLLFQKLLPAVQAAGFGLGLTGGVLRNGVSDHDVDVIVYPLQSSSGDMMTLKATLTDAGMKLFRSREEMTAGWRERGSLDEKWVEVWELDGKRIDLLFLR
jgi:hypothetical protein